MVVAGLWAGALITFVAPLLTKPSWSYYRYNDNQKMCGLHWEYTRTSTSLSEVEDENGREDEDDDNGSDNVNNEGGRVGR